MMTPPSGFLPIGGWALAAGRRCVSSVQSRLASERQMSQLASKEMQD